LFDNVRIEAASNINQPEVENERARKGYHRKIPRNCSGTAHRVRRMKLQLLAAMAFASGDAFLPPSKLPSKKLVEPSQAIGRALEGRRVAERGLSMKSQATPVKTDVSLAGICVRNRLSLHLSRIYSACSLLQRATAERPRNTDGSEGRKGESKTCSLSQQCSSCAKCTPLLRGFPACGVRGVHLCYTGLRLQIQHPAL